MKKRSILLLLVTVMVVMVGCSAKPTMKTIAGTYKSETSGSEMTITKNGDVYESGLYGTCEIVEGKLIIRASIFSIVYDIQKQDGYYLLVHKYGNYIPEMYYDDYMAMQAV